MTTHRYVVAGDGMPPVVAGAPYTPAVVAGDLCFVSGQLAIDSDGGFRPGSAAEEARLTLENLLATLRAADFAAQDLVWVNVVLADMSDWQAVNEVYAALVPAPHPARMAYAAGALAFGARVEIQAIAARQPSR